MISFRKLQRKHESLLRYQQSGKPIVKQAQDYLAETFNAGLHVTNPAQRDQLRANNRYWAIYIFEETKVFPNSEISPPSREALTRRRYILWLLRGLGVMLLSACLLAGYSFIANKRISVESIALQPCTPEAARWNPYNNPTNGLAGTIYNNLAQTPNPQQQAFELLVHEVRQWSDHVDVLIPDNRIVRITVTFLSRELIESVVLNQILYSGVTVSPDFNMSVQYALQDIARREELLFLVTITASEYRDSLLPADALVVQIPLDEMFFITSDNLSIKPGHRDGFLMYEIDLHGQPEHGYIAYPVAVKVDEHCRAVLDEHWDTSLSLHVSRL